MPCAPTGSPESVPRSGAPDVVAVSGPMLPVAKERSAVAYEQVSQVSAWPCKPTRSVYFCRTDMRSSCRNIARVAKATNASAAGSGSALEGAHRLGAPRQQPCATTFTAGRLCKEGWGMDVPHSQQMLHTACCVVCRAPIAGSPSALRRRRLKGRGHTRCDGDGSAHDDAVISCRSVSNDGADVCTFQTAPC